MKRIIAAGFDFDKWISTLPEYEIFESGRNTNMPLHPAHYWPHVPGRDVDFVGKVEHFDRDFTSLCAFLEIEKPTIQVVNATTDEQQSTVVISRYAGKMSGAL